MTHSSERSPLLEHQNAKHNGIYKSTNYAGTDPDFVETSSSVRLILHELWVLTKGAVPVALAYALQNSLQAVAVLIVGRKSPEDLSTAAFSFLTAHCTAWLMAMGGSTALDTLASSTFTGSKNKHDLGVLLQRSFIILGLFYVPIAILWIFSKPVFIALGQTERLSTDSARFLTNLVPGGLGYIYFETMKKYLQAQGIMRPGTYILLITSPISAALNYVFVYVADWGVYSVPFATGIGYWLSFLGLVLYTRFVAGSECWGGWSKRSLHNLGSFAKLAFLGFTQVATEWWSFEIVALAAGHLGEIPLASQSVMMTADQFMNTIPYGISVATSARVGNVLGSRDAKGASRSAHTAAWFGTFVGAIMLAILMATRNVFARFASDDERVIKLTADVMPYFALVQLADGIGDSCSGALRGMGKQKIGAILNVLSYYGFAIPLGIHLAFHGWGLPGLWLGQNIALFTAGFAQWAILFFSNWDREVEKAFDRMDHPTAELSDD